MNSEAPRCVCDGVIVRFDYVIRDASGGLVDASTPEEPGIYLHGAENIASGLERALTGAVVGASLTVEVSPEEGFGERDARAPLVVSRELFPVDEALQVGCNACPRTTTERSRCCGSPRSGTVT